MNYHLFLTTKVTTYQLNIIFGDIKIENEHTQKYQQLQRESIKVGLRLQCLANRTPAISIKAKASAHCMLFNIGHISTRNDKIEWN